MKEFLSVRAIDFVSRDIANDADALTRLQGLGADAVPVVADGGRWVPGIDLGQVADLLGVNYDPRPALPPDILNRRLRHALATSMRLTAQLPSASLLDKLPNRDRTCLALANHVVEIAAGYLAVLAGRDFDHAISGAVPAVELDREALADRAGRVQDALTVGRPWVEREVGTFFGPSTLHAVLERCTWHVAQHTRQLAMVLEGLGMAPDEPLGAADLDGLPMPARVWDS